MEGTMAVITNWAPDFAPKNWQFCSGQLIAITTNQALFSLLGNTYGGDGRTTFGLPNLQSRTAVGTGPNNIMGQLAGAPTATLSISNIPPHTHSGLVNLALKANSTDGGGDLEGGYPGMLTNGYSNAQPDVNMKQPTNTSVQIAIAGASQPYSTEAPYLAINYIICMYGIYPSRN